MHNRVRVLAADAEVLLVARCCSGPQAERGRLAESDYKAALPRSSASMSTLRLCCLHLREVYLVKDSLGKEHGQTSEVPERGGEAISTARTE